MRARRGLGYTAAMRGAWASWLAVLAILGAAPGRAQDDATAAPLALTLAPPPALAVGDRAEIVALLARGPTARGPVLLTPTSEGSAVEVVRGRLLTIDADDRAADPLRFRIPIVAATAGTSVVRVRASGWACEPACRAVEVESRVVLEVRR